MRERDHDQLIAGGSFDIVRCVHKDMPRWWSDNGTLTATDERQVIRTFALVVPGLFDSCKLLGSQAVTRERSFNWNNNLQMNTVFQNSGLKN